MDFVDSKKGDDFQKPDMVQLSEVGHTIMDGGNCLWQTRMGEDSPTNS